MKILFFTQDIDKHKHIDNINLRFWKKHINVTCQRVDSNVKVYNIILKLIETKEHYVLLAYILYDGNLGEHHNDFADMYNLSTLRGVYPGDISEEWYEIKEEE